MHIAEIAIALDEAAVSLRIVRMHAAREGKLGKDSLRAQRFHSAHQDVRIFVSAPIAEGHDGASTDASHHAGAACAIATERDVSDMLYAILVAQTLLHASERHCDDVR